MRQTFATEKLSEPAGCAPSLRQKTVSIDLEQDPLLAQPRESLWVLLEGAAALRVRERDSHPPQPHLIEQMLEHRDVARRLDQQVFAPLTIGREPEVFIRGLERPNERYFCARNDLKSNAGGIDLLLCTPAPHRDFLYANAGKIGPEVRSRGQDRRSRVGRRSRHLNRSRPVLGPVVDAGKQMGMNVHEPVRAFHTRILYQYDPSVLGLALCALRVDRPGLAPWLLIGFSLGAPLVLALVLALS